MARVRISTTVDEELLKAARTLDKHTTDAALIDASLSALLLRHRSAQIDQSYEVYDEQPLDESDDWGDLSSFREAAAAE
jgi:hypothetical protein